MVLLQKDDLGRQVLRHSTAHVLAQAVLSIWPDAKYAGGPPIEDGFYYDFDIGRPFTPEDLEKIEARMSEIIKEDQPFSREEVSIEEAAELFKDQPYKSEWISEMDPEAQRQGVIGDKVSLYKNADKFVDLCRGPHLPSTGRIKSFKLTRSSAAYWRGDEKRPMLQRIYGTAWESPKAQEQYLWRLEEAQKRDHRKLGSGDGPVQLPARDRRRPGGLPPQGRADPQDHGGLLPGRARGGRLRVRGHSRTWRRRPCSPSPGTSAGTRTACTPRWRWRAPPTTPSR